MVCVDVEAVELREGGEIVREVEEEDAREIFSWGGGLGFVVGWEAGEEGGERGGRGEYPVPVPTSAISRCVVESWGRRMLGWRR